MRGRLILAFLLVFTVCAISVQAAGPPEPPTADVNVVNTPDVNVANTDSDPVPVTVTNGNSQKTPWQYHEILGNGDGEEFARGSILCPSEPLTINYVSAVCTLPPGQAIYIAAVGPFINGSFFPAFIPMSFQASNRLGSLDFWYGGEQVLLHCEDGGGITISFGRDSTTTSFTCELTVSGYTESAS